MIKKAHVLYMADKFTVPKIFHELGRCRTPYTQNANPIGVALYDLYKNQRSKARKTRRLFYDDIRVFNALLEEHCMATGDTPQMVNLDNRKRRRWLTSWAKQYNVSFRVVNKKYKLSNDERTIRLGQLWRDIIRVQQGLAAGTGNVVL